MLNTRRMSMLPQGKMVKGVDSPTSRAAMDSNISLFLAYYRGTAAFRSGKGGFKTPKYQNSYRLSSYNPFKCEVVDKILQDVMSSYLTSIRYQPATCMKICQDMSSEVRSRLIKKDFDRYKYIVTMSIIERIGQSVNIDMGCLWDVERDTYCTYVFEHTDFYAVGMVVGTYYE